MKVNGQLHSMAALPLGTEPSLATDGRLCGPRASLDMVANVKIPYPPGNKYWSPNPQLVTLLIESSLLHLVQQV